MPTVVHVPELDEDLEFPDDASESDIASAIQDHISQKSSRGGPVLDQLPYFQNLPSSPQDNIGGTPPVGNLLRASPLGLPPGSPFEMSAEDREQGGQLVELDRFQRGLAPPTEEGGLGTQLAQGIPRGLAQLGEQAWGALEGAGSVAEHIPTGAVPGVDFLRTLRPFAGERREVAAENVANLETIARGTGGPKFAGDVVAGAISSAPSIATVPIGGFIPAVVAAGVQSYGAAFSEAKQRGLDDFNAQQDGLVKGAITAGATLAFGKTGIEALATPAVREGFKKSLMEIFVKGGVAEGFEEMSDTVVSTTYDYLRRDPSITFEDGLSRALQSLGIGAIVGSGVTAVAQAGAPRQPQVDSQTQSIETLPPGESALQGAPLAQAQAAPETEQPPTERPNFNPPIQVKGPDGKMHWFTFDGSQDFEGIEVDGKVRGVEPQLTAMEDVPGEGIIKGGTTYGYRLAEEGYTLPDNFPSQEEVKAHSDKARAESTKPTAQQPVTPESAGFEKATIGGETSHQLKVPGGTMLVNFEGEGSIRLRLIGVQKASRRAGVGTALINKLKTVADSQGRDVVLVARPPSGESQESLNKFYEKQGFKKQGDDPVSKYPVFLYASKSTTQGQPNETTQEAQAPGVLASAQPIPVLGTSFNPPAAGRSGLEKAQAPPGQTFAGPVQEREATAPTRSTLGQYDYSVQTEEARDKFAKNLLEHHRGDFDGAYRDVAQIDDSAYRAVATSALLEQELEKLANSNVADRLQIEQNIRRISSDLKLIKSSAGQALQAESQVNNKIGPYMALLSYMDLIRQRNPAATIENDPTAQKLADLAVKAKKAPEGIRRNKVYQEMIDTLNSLEGISVSDLFRDVWYGSVLARTGTMLNVLAGGYATGALFTLSSSLGAAITGNPRAAIQMIGQFLAGTYEAALTAKEIVTEGQYTLLPDFAERAENLLSRKKGARKDTLEILWKRGGLTAAYPGVLAYTRRLITALDYIGALGTRDAQLIFTALSRGDQDSLNAIQKRFDKTENKRAETQAKEEMGTGASRAEVLTRKREILEEGVSKEVKAGALEIARRVAANAEPRGLTKVVYDMISKMPFFARAPLGLGFIRAAMNMVANSAEFYPVIGGITAARAELFARLPEGHPLKAFGFDLPIEQRRLVMANQALGLGITGLLAAMFLGGDDDEGWELSGNWLGLSPAQSKALRDKGEKPYAIRFGKKGPWIVYKQLPLAGPLAIIGNMRDQKRFRNKEWTGQSAGEQITSAWLSGLLYIKDLSALSGLTRIFGGEAGRTQEKPETLAKKANMMAAESAGRFGSGYIPSLIKEIDEFMDPKLYRPRLKGGVSGFWLRNVPFARRTVGEGPDLNIFGDPVNVGRPPLRAWIGVEKDGPLWETVGRLTSEGVFPPIPGRTATVVTDAGERRQMTEKEFYDYQSKWGREFKAFVEERIEDFSTATPEEAEALYDAFRDSFGPVIRSGVTVEE